MTRDRDLVDMNFELVAERYSGRVPYLSEFFANAVKLFGLSRSSTVLDLGCGTGALALGFAPYCGSVLGVDKSASMIAHRRESPDNVRFLTADLNAGITSLPVCADLVVIGNAVHFFEKAQLIPLLNAVTTPSASIFVCGTSISKHTPWFAQYVKLRKQYSTLATSLDVYGRACFSGTPWSRERSLVVSAQKEFGVRDLLAHALSYPSSLEGILKNKDDFEGRLEKILAPYRSACSQAAGEIMSWGVEYTRTR